MEQFTKRQVSRRRLLRTAVRVGGLAVAAPLVQACQQASPTPSRQVSQLVNPTPSATELPTATPSWTAVPSPTVTPYPTATLTASATPSPTATANAPSTAPPTATASPEPTPNLTTDAEAELVSVAFVKTTNRAAGVRRALELLSLNPAQGKQVMLKPNFNSDDPCPGSTHPDTLRALVEELWGMGARTITVGDRSGMGLTQRVMENLGVVTMAQELGFETLAFDRMYEPTGWELVTPHDSHWKHGFPFARPCLEADALVQTCNLKTHQYGGHFTLSLKNSVGMVNRDLKGTTQLYMDELHSSMHQRAMIAEINTAYTPDLIVLDGVEAFTAGGPATGRLVASEVVLAGTDRVAIDAVGVAILRYFHTTSQVSRGPIFELEQIARAVELGLGVDVPEKIRLVTGDAESEAHAAQIRQVLLAGRA